MLIIPAIDIKAGSVVRLVQGRRDKKVYSEDPVKTAMCWASQGAPYLHVVDLDGAMTGIPKHLELLKQIVKSVPVPVEFGGGVRTEETVHRVLTLGAKRVVLGTRAVEDEQFLRGMVRAYGERVIVSIDAKGGIVQVKGWQKDASGPDAMSFGMLLKSIGFTQAIFTDIAKDGTLKGPNMREIERLTMTGLGIIASGGVSSLEDIRALKGLEKKGVTGIIVGKALYEGAFTLNDALRYS